MIPEDRILAVIVGRSGSKGLPGKNARLLAGRPVICHTIDDAKASSLIDRVIVSTDGDAIAAAAEHMGVEVVHRPSELATDTATVDSAVRHAVEVAGAGESLIVILYANVPIRPVGLIDRAIELLMHTGADSVQSYSDVGKHHPYWMVTLDGSDAVQPHVVNAVYRRQDLPRLYIPDGGVIAVTTTSLSSVVEGEPHAFLGKDRRGIVSHGPVVDIDDALDMATAEAILRTRDCAASH